MKTYNKLVRDNIDKIMIDKGLKPITRILSEEEYIKELNKKLLEEVKEYLESEEVEELADIEEVILAILDTKKVSRETLEEIRKEKTKKRGAFTRRLFLEKEL